MTHHVEGSGVQLSEMPLAGRLALSAAALLLLILAYRYYKSRVSPGSTLPHAADARAEQREWQICSRTKSNEAAPPGLRHRGGRETEPCCQGTNQRLQVGRGGVAEECKQAWRALCDARETEAEEKQEAGKVSHPETGLQGQEQDWVSEDKAEEMFCTSQSGSSKDGADLGSNSRALDLLNQESEPCSSYSDRMGPGWDADSVDAESSHAKPVGREVQPKDGSEIGLKRGQGQQVGKDSRGQVEESQIGQERIQSFHATSDIGLAINQSHMQSHVAYAFSSVAKVHVEENFIKERNPKEQNSGKAESQDSHLRGKVYHLCVQSTSQSVMNKNTHRTNLDPPQPGNLSTINMLRVSKECLTEEADHSSVTEKEADKFILEKVPDISSKVLLSSTEAIQPEGQREAVVVEEAFSPKPSVARYSFSRKESFHKIADNPEFQVPMEGFGSPAIGPSSGDTLLPVLHSNSTSSLVGSMQNLQRSRREKPVVELVAGAKFFHVPLSLESSLDVRLDLGNCYEMLCMAKKQKLKDLQEAAYKVMSDNYLQVLKTQAIYRQLNAAERDLILQKRMQGKKYMTVADISSHNTSRLCYYDDEKDTWYPLTHVPVEAISRGCAICSMFNYLFVVAGCEGRGRYQKPSNRVFCYNPLTNIWQEICPLNQARPHCTVVALDGCLYAIGGECLYTVERYDPRLDRWTFAAPLPNDTFAVAHTATVCDGEICVTGGTLRYMLLKYAGRTDTWKVSLTGGSQDRTTEMVTADGFIYRFDLNQRMGISVYRCSAKAKLWYECATHPMPFPPCFQCAVIGNLVYCVNRQFNIRFLADLVSPRFGAKELKTFPSPRGTLIPVILTLPEGGSVQTRL